MEVFVLLRFLIVIMLISASLFAQSDDKDKASFGIKFFGFVKTDVIYDSRQTIAARDGQFLLYPDKEILDQNGNDINAVPNFNMLSLQTRLSVALTAPDVFGAKTSGLVEGSFFGQTDGDLNGFRLRHAFLKLTWEKSSLLIGQYWHPMFITEAFPGTISFNTGVPFQPFSRNPQISYMYGINDIYISVTAATQADFLSTGPIGSSSSYLRNSGSPILNLTMKYKLKSFLVGAGVNHKTLLPRLEETNASGEKYKTDTKVSSTSAMGFAKVVFNDFTIKAEGVYAENATDLLMLGGYAVSDTTLDGNGFVSGYTGIKTLSAWTELIYGKALQFGIFAGYTKNLGAADDIKGSYYSRGKDIANVMRISPRVQYSIGKTRFALEFEYTSADYGTPDLKGVVENATTVANMRLLFAAYLFF